MHTIRRPPPGHDRPAGTIHERPTRPSGRRPGTRRRLRLGWAFTGLAALALLAAACSGASPSGGGLYGAAPATAGSPPAATVVDLRGSMLGQTLVDGRGRTLYLFEADKAGKSACDGACAGVWPPYVSNGTPRAGTGVRGALLGTSSRGDGSAQVTYRGHPLYFYAGDDRPGDAAGQGLNQFGARWYVLAPSGDEIIGAN